MKILQSLPAILQSYKKDIHAESLFITLQICGILASNKTAVIANTSAATFQQLVSTVFEEVAVEDGMDQSSLEMGQMLITTEDSNSPRNVEIRLDDKTLSVGPRASDAYRVCHPLASRSSHL